jgi:Ca2+-binding EF-hand superfamily protein
MTAVWTSRLHCCAEFYLLDINKDGVVERDDLMGLATRIAERSGWSEGSAEYERVSTAYDAIWSSFWAASDTDGDGRVTIDERFAGLEFFDSLPAEELKSVASPPISAVFDALDLDGDGEISRGEYSACVTALGVSEADADEAFEKLDANSDGRLTRDEYIDRLIEFYASSDPEVAGNWAWAVR